MNKGFGTLLKMAYGRAVAQQMVAPLKRRERTSSDVCNLRYLVLEPKNGKLTKY